MSEKESVVINLLNFSDAQIAGAGVFAKNLLRGWLRSDASRDIVIYHADTIDAAEVFGLREFKGVKYHPSSARNFLSRIFYEQLILPFLIRGFTIYFSPTPVMPFLSKFLNRRMRHVITIHDMTPFFVPHKYGRLRSLYVKFISKIGARMASHVITVSENSKRDICEISRVTPDKISVVYNFMPDDTRNEKISYERFFVSISTIEPGKNIENTLRGFKNFLANLPNADYKFYWIGKVGWGYTQQDLTSEIETLKLQDSFFLLGYVSEEKKRDFLRACTAMVYLSHYEGFGLPVLEALHFNKPSVVSNTSSLPEVIGEAGILCDKEDVASIEHALNDVVSNLKTYVGRIPIQLQKFTESSQIKKFLTVLEMKA